MTAEEEAAYSSALDNPVVLEAYTEVWSLHDTGFQQGHIDGVSGKPMYPHSPSVPELFRYTYALGHAAGRKKREEDRIAKKEADKAAKAIRERDEELVRLLGSCRVTSCSDNVVEPEVKSVETPNIGNIFEKKEEGFFKKYGSAILGTVASGIVFGFLGLYVGKVQERKRCMDVKRDMGVSDGK